MSYEGYEVHYCKACGCRKETRDSYFCMDDSIPCPLCGSTEEVTDSVDETNGCVCDELIDGWDGKEISPACPCHEKITKEDLIETIGRKVCPCCKGMAVVPEHKRYNIDKLKRS